MAEFLNQFNLPARYAIIGFAVGIVAAILGLVIGITDDVAAIVVTPVAFAFVAGLVGYSRARQRMTS